jgi:hypothetical protein
VIAGGWNIIMLLFFGVVVIMIGISVFSGSSNRSWRRRFRR